MPLGDLLGTIGDLLTGDLLGGETGIGDLLLDGLLDSLFGDSTGSFGSS